MRNALRKGGLLLAVTAGALLAAPAPASAAPVPASSPAPNCHRVHQQAAGNFGILTGNNFYLPLDFNLNATDNAVALLGLASTNNTRGDTLYKIHCGN